MMRAIPCLLLTAWLGCQPLKGGAERADASEVDSESEAGPTDGGDATVTALDCALRHPPSPPDAASVAANRDSGSAVTNDLVFAISSTEYGSQPTDAGGPRFPTIGFDLDNMCTGVGSCIEPRVAATVQHHVGVDGIDNAYGQVVQGVFPDSLNASGAAPQALFRIANYSGAANEDPVDVALYGTVGLAPRGDGGVGPLWDGKDRWIIMPEFLLDPTDGGLPSVDQPRFHADRAYVTSGTLVALFNTTLWPGGLAIAPRLLVTARQFTMAGKLVRVGDAGDRWELQDLVAGFRISMADSLVVLGLTPSQAPTDGNPNQPICQDPPTYQTTSIDLCAAADITADPSAPPSSTCDGLSVGLLYQAKQAVLGDIAGPAPDLPPCAPGVNLYETCDSLAVDP